jgi:hypothetical protein
MIIFIIIFKILENKNAIMYKVQSINASSVWQLCLYLVILSRPNRLGMGEMYRELRKQTQWSGFW